MKTPSQVRIEVHPSALWQLNSVLVFDRHSCLVVDPGYLPKEVDRLVQRTKHHQVEALSFTHGHFDHVMGGSSFPQVPAWVSPVLKQRIQQHSQEAPNDHNDIEEFDRRYYISRTKSFCWPQVLVDISEESKLTLGTLEIKALLLPGHSADGLALYLSEIKTLIVGDYLSPCEIPFIEDAQAYHHTLIRLLALLPQMQQVIPGHGPLLSAEQAQLIAEADLRYVDALLACQKNNDWLRAEALPLPRADNVPGMKEEHLQNCRKLGLGKQPPDQPIG